MYAKLAEIVQSGAIGKVTVARAALTNNMAPDGIGRLPDSEPPPGLDWDMWLGPRPERPFNLNILPYKFRWWNLYSSQMANWGAHYLDAMRWILHETAPASISAHGGVFAVNDCRSIPDTAQAIFEHASGVLTMFSTFEASGQPLLIPRRDRVPRHPGHRLCQHEPDRDHPRTRRRLSGPRSRA